MDKTEWIRLQGTVVTAGRFRMVRNTKPKEGEGSEIPLLECEIEQPKETGVITVVFWRDKAVKAKALQKGDRVIVSGKWWKSKFGNNSFAVSQWQKVEDQKNTNRRKSIAEIVPRDKWNAFQSSYDKSLENRGYVKVYLETSGIKCRPYYYQRKELCEKTPFGWASKMGQENR